MKLATRNKQSLKYALLISEQIRIKYAHEVYLSSPEHHIPGKQCIFAVNFSIDAQAPPGMARSNYGFQLQLSDSYGLAVRQQSVRLVWGELIPFGIKPRPDVFRHGGIQQIPISYDASFVMIRHSSKISS